MSYYHFDPRQRERGAWLKYRQELRNRLDVTSVAADIAQLGTDMSDVQGYMDDASALDATIQCDRCDNDIDLSADACLLVFVAAQGGFDATEYALDNDVIYTTADRFDNSNVAPSLVFCTTCEATIQARIDGRAFEANDDAALAAKRGA